MQTKTNLNQQPTVIWLIAYGICCLCIILHSAAAKPSLDSMAEMSSKRTIFNDAYLFGFDCNTPSHVVTHTMEKKEDCEVEISTPSPKSEERHYQILQKSVKSRIPSLPSVEVRFLHVLVMEGCGMC